MKRKNGFTLIELLVVVILLALIAVMVTPIVYSSIEKAQKESFGSSVNGLLRAVNVEREYGVAQTYTVKDGKVTPTLSVKGKIEGEGTITVTEEGEITISITNGKYCAKKGKDDKKIIVEDGTCS